MKSYHVQFSAVFSILFFLFLFLLPFSSGAQTISGKSPKSELFHELARVDSLMFEVSYNSCDSKKADQLIAKDVEFYHDRGGLIDTTSAGWIQSIENECPGDYGKKRELVEGSLEVYPMNNYGAIQMGEHKFYEKQEDGSYQLYEKAKYTHLWKKEENGQWKLTRVLSYDHQPVE